MLYSVLIYASQQNEVQKTSEEHEQQLAAHHKFQQYLKDEKRLINVVRLRDTENAITLKKSTIIDGPFAETKEQFVGFYIFLADNMAHATDICQLMPNTGSLEIRPIRFFEKIGIDDGSSTIFKDI